MAHTPADSKGNAAEAAVAAVASVALTAAVQGGCWVALALVIK